MREIVKGLPSVRTEPSARPVDMEQVTNRIRRKRCACEPRALTFSIAVVAILLVIAIGGLAALAALIGKGQTTGGRNGTVTTVTTAAGPILRSDPVTSATVWRATPTPSVDDTCSSNAATSAMSVFVVETSSAAGCPTEEPMNTTSAPKSTRRPPRASKSINM